MVAKLREEQARVVAAHGPAITRASLDAMTYLDAVVREAQYVSPSAAMNFRWVGLRPVEGRCGGGFGGRSECRYAVCGV